ncbi:hypothetical protein RJ641_009043 [Dillenia turbinata]|uniref:Uncharacterized protein n=1 Tax=Dillenia turbinata TaxID=194707 RepID=A0AAN8VC96_9MAGN
MVSKVEVAMKQKQQQQQQQQHHQQQLQKQIMQCNKGKGSKFKRSSSNLEEDGASSAILLLACIALMTNSFCKVPNPLSVISNLFSPLEIA